MKPTDSELQILGVLWRMGPSTVRTVNDELNKERRVGYTNTLKMMQLMHDKGLLNRDESSRSHIYSPAIEARAIKSNVLSNMIDTVFEGNPSKLLVHALGNYTPSREELDEIKSIIQKIEEDGNAH